MHLRLLERLSLSLLWWQSVLFLSSLRKRRVPLWIVRQQPSCPQTGMERVSGAVLGPERSQWHSGRKCSSRAIHCAEGRPTGWFRLSISSCLGVSGLLHTPACRNIGGEEICENTPGTWQPVTAMIRLSCDWWVTDGRARMAGKCAAFQWSCRGALVLMFKLLTAWDIMVMLNWIMGYN